jgi:carboxyl-terminal processing protease
VKKDPGQVFTTKGGRKVYGGGGITPDIFVAFDTSFLQRSVAGLYNDNSVFIFPYNYYLGHQQELKQYKDPIDFGQRFNNYEALWNELLRQTRHDSIRLDKVNASEKSFLLNRVKANIARQLWRTKGFYQVWNMNDPVIARALVELKK